MVCPPAGNPRRQGSRPASGVRPAADEGNADLMTTSDETMQPQAIVPQATGAPPVAALLHELQVRQVELETQNEALRLMQGDLETARDRYLDLYDFAPVGYLTLDSNGMIEEMNLTAAALLGHERRDLLQRCFSSLVAAEDQPCWAGFFLSVKKPGGKGTVDVAVQRGDGTLFQAQLDCAGSTALRLVLSDVSEKKRLGEELDHYRRHLEELVAERTAELAAAVAHTRLIIDSSAEGILQLDAAGHIALINPAACRMLGYAPEELLGRDVHASIHCPPDAAAPRAPCSLGVAMRAGQALREDGETFWRADGRPLPVSVATHPMREGEAVIGAVMSFSDNSQRQAADEEREAARAAAELLARTRSEFLANMSHEIRTPINAVLGFSHICQTLDLPERAGGYVGKIRSAAESLLHVVNDILDFSKIEAGKLEMETIPFDLAEVLDQTASMFKMRLRDKGVELVIGAMPGIPERLLGDPLRLGQVLINLTGNAVKFTERGEISLIAMPLEADADSVTLRFDVRDSGLGMTPQQRSTLFTAFNQADSSTTRKFGGTGLGLAISKQLVEHMGGKISVESEPGVGSCFSVTARFGIAPRVAARTRVDSLKGKRILVVDDNAVMRTLHVRTLQSFGCVADAVDSGEETLARLQAEAGFDLVMLDWCLGGMDGLETARRIRAAGNPVPLVLITGGEPEMARAQMTAGEIQAFLAKPVARAVLHDALLDVLAGRTAAPLAVAAPIAAPVLTGSRILLVDDNDFNREVGRELVELTGAVVDTVDDGAQAVAAVAAGGYDLVLMDLQMPVMDGYTAARIIRESRPGLPIIALTAHAMIEEKTRVLAAGMNGIVTKPILPEVLYAVLARFLGGDQPRQEAPGHLPPPAAAPPATAAPPRTPAAEVATLPMVFDHATALTRVSGNEEMLRRFLNMFRQRNADIVTQIGAALAAPDLPSARRLVHTLKGGAGTIGMMELQAGAARLEETLADALADAPGNDDQAANFQLHRAS